jgi:hypothetical protein
LKFYSPQPEVAVLADARQIKGVTNDTN